jgi:hypothetical protein
MKRLQVVKKPAGRKYKLKQPKPGLAIATLSTRA